MHTEYKYESRQDSGYGDSEKNAFEYVEYLGAHWRLILSAVVAAMVLSLSISLLLPKRYTATASIVIEPPAGNDVRTATAVSPVYLESLRTYERFADSDSLFAGAAEHFHLSPSEGGRSIESLKQRVLKVTKLRDTKILEIAVTLREPVLAQQFVRYVAEETVKLSRGESAAADHEVMSEAERQSIEAQQRLDRAQQAWILDAAHESGGALPAQIDGEVELAAKVAQSLSDARSDIAEYQEKAGYAAALPGLRARASELDRRLQEIEKSIERKSTIASQRAASQEKLEVELKMAQTASEAGAARLRELRATAGTRGERLRIIDPGIVPQRPTSPNVALNVFAALVLTLAGLAAYLTVAFSYHRRGR